jgi:hypothetical protein
VVKIQGIFDTLNTQSGWEILVKVKEERKRGGRVTKKSLDRLGTGERQDKAFS